MKTYIRFLSSLLILFSGYYFGVMNERANQQSESKPTVKEIAPKVTGIGGIFFKAENPAVLKEWYGNHLGLVITDVGSPFEFRNAHRPDEINYLTWIPFVDSTSYFAPSKKEFMINYRVQNIDSLVENLRKNGVTLLDELTSYPYGRFIHIIDLEGNKIELWEPNDKFFTEIGGETTK